MSCSIVSAPLLVAAPQFSLTPNHSPPHLTGKGLYSVDITHGFSLDLIVNMTPGPAARTGGSAAAAPPPDQRPPLDIEWNWNTKELYTCGHGGVIRTYRQT